MLSNGAFLEERRSKLVFFFYNIDFYEVVPLYFMMVLRCTLKEDFTLFSLFNVTV